MKQFIVVSGGSIDDAFASEVIASMEQPVLIAADHGMEFFYRNRMKPHVIVGDFDSAAPEAVAFFKEQPDVEIRELNPMKDDTDTESAVRLALSMGAEEITLLGATGSRLDHVLGNIELLGIGLNGGVPVVLRDANNRIRMTDRGMTIKRSEQFGRYVSLIPYTQKVEHLTLRGFKYPLSDHCLEGFCSLGVSNEIEQEDAVIEFDGGILLVIESRDEA